MRVRVATNGKGPALRAGMSVEVEVDTGHARGLPHFLTALLGLQERTAG
jgi:membrane fusion protein (multidrug efflux system)